MAEGFKKVPVMAWDFQFFFVGANPKKMCQLWHGIFKTFFVGVNQKNKVSVMACLFQNLIVFGGCPPKK